MKFISFNPDGQVVIINGDKQLGFSSREEFEKYTGLDAPTAYSVHYEPSRNSHVEFDGTKDTIKPIPDSFMEAIFVNLDTYISRVNNKYYKVNLDEAKEIKKKEVYEIYRERKNQDFEYPEGSGIFYEMSKEAVTETLDVCERLGLADADQIPANDGYWDNVSGHDKVAFTVGMLSELYITAYMIPAENYKVKGAYNDTIDALKSVEDVVALNINVGWK